MCVTKTKRSGKEDPWHGTLTLCVAGLKSRVVAVSKGSKATISADLGILGTTESWFTTLALDRPRP